MYSDVLELAGSDNRTAHSSIYSMCTGVPLRQQGVRLRQRPPACAWLVEKDHRRLSDERHCYRQLPLVT